jgi:hypothetical protein
LLLLFLRPGAGVLSDGHRISFDDPRRKIQTHPQMLPVGLRISGGNIPAKRHPANYEGLTDYEHICRDDRDGPAAPPG